MLVVMRGSSPVFTIPNIVNSNLTVDMFKHVKVIYIYIYLYIYTIYTLFKYLTVHVIHIQILDAMIPKR